MRSCASLLVSALCLMVGSLCMADLIEAYPDPERMYDEIRVMAQAYPDNVELIEYGRSVEDRPLYALRFHLNDGVPRPGGMVAANIHGEEWIGNRTAMAVAHRIINGIQEPWIRDVLSRMDLYVIPCINPDGYYRTWESAGKNKLRDMRKNKNSVDLNRNFPHPRGKKIKERKPDSVNYPGPKPLSEPETRAVVDFVIERNIIATVDYHSVRGEIITPACSTMACTKRYARMCRAYSRNQKHPLYFWLVTPPGFETPGMMEPYLYYEYGVMAILIELGFSSVNAVQNRSVNTFEVFNPRNPDFWAYNDSEAAIRALDAAYRETGGKAVPPDQR